MARRKNLVHFTHHECVAQGLWKPLEANEKSRRMPYGRTPSLGACRHWNRAPALTTNPKAVTCNGCKQWLADGTAQAWARKARQASTSTDRQYYSEWRSNRECTKLAWKQCCVDRGTPWPFSVAEAKAELRNLIADAVYLPTKAYGLGGDLEESVSKIANLAPDVAEALRPAIDACTMANDLLTEVRRLHQEADAHVEAIRERVRAGELAESVQWPGVAAPQIGASS